MDNNPYATPESSEAPAPWELVPMAELVRSWEKCRLYFNAILFLPGVVVLALWVTRQNMPAGAAVASGVFVGAAANLAFFLGPLSELYLRGFWLGGRPLGRGRWLIFSAGVVFSLGLFSVFAAFAFL